MKSLFVVSLILTITFALPAKESGKNFLSIENRIAGGNPAVDGQFPFQVGVQTLYVTKDNRAYTAWCGGSLISDKVVLTAAHCVDGARSAEIFLGAVDITKNPLIIKVGKEGMIMHEEYKSFQGNDIALILLPQKVVLTDKIQTVNLPRKSQRGMSFEKVVGWISGWGYLGDQRESPEILQYTRRWILPHSYCEYHFGPTYKKDIEICVDGSHGISACQGDSGGPLTIVEEDGSRTLVGCTSFGKVLCEQGYPSVYTRITAHLDWISKKSGIPLRD